MYYIGDTIEMRTGLNIFQYSFHYISRIHIDYVNQKTSAQISSTINKDKWVEDEYSAPHVNFYELDRAPAFNEDPNQFVLKKLVTIPATVFYKAKVSVDYDIPKIPTNK